MTAANCLAGISAAVINAPLQNYSFNLRTSYSANLSATIPRLLNSVSKIAPISCVCSIRLSNAARSSFNVTGYFVAVTTEFRPHVFADDPDDVRARVGGVQRTGNERQQNQSDEFHHSRDASHAEIVTGIAIEANLQAFQPACML